MKTQEIKEITTAIYGLSVIMEEDGCRQGSAEEKPVLDPFHQGSLIAAIKLLSTYGIGLAEDLVEEEQCQADSTGQHDRKAEEVSP